MKKRHFVFKLTFCPQPDGQKAFVMTAAVSLFGFSAGCSNVYLPGVSPQTIEWKYPDIPTALAGHDCLMAWCSLKTRCF